MKSLKKKKRVQPISGKQKVCVNNMRFSRGEEKVVRYSPARSSREEKGRESRGYPDIKKIPMNSLDRHNASMAFQRISLLNLVPS